MKRCSKGHGPLKQDGWRVNRAGAWIPHYAECVECHAAIRQELKRLVKKAQDVLDYPDGKEQSPEAS